MSRDKNEAGASRGLPKKEKRMSREDDFDDIMDSDEVNAGQDDSSEPLLDLESVDESPADETDLEAPEAAEPAAPMTPPPSRKPAKKKKKAVAKPKAKAKKKTAKPARKPAKKKTAKKPAKKKTRPAAKKKKARKKR